MPVIANLLELYAHDFSEFHSIEPGPDGRFGYPGLSLYWSEPGRYPFLIKINGKLAGFVLVHKILQTSGSNTVWDVAEFFVLRAYRRRGVGREAAHSVLRQFPGHWQVRVMQANRTAHRFWQRAIAEFPPEEMGSTSVEKAGELWDVFSFSTFA
jgi:predicted acetyltransferase